MALGADAVLVAGSKLLHSTHAEEAPISNVARCRALDCHGGEQVNRFTREN